jgi:hypothetical protein
MPIAAFIDLPAPENLRSAVNGWQSADFPAGFPGCVTQKPEIDFAKISSALLKTLSSSRSARSHKRLQKQAID